MAETNPLADGLLKIHKLISRALDVSLNKCDEYIRRKEIPAEEEYGFMLFMTTLIRVMHSHHMGEDEIVFPYFSGRVDASYERLREEHIRMSLMLDDLEHSLRDESIQDMPVLRNQLEAIRLLWAPHIKDEESCFSADIISGKISGKEQKELADRVAKHGAKSSGPGPLTLPFVIYNLQGEDRKEFTRDFPWILKHFLIPVVWRRKWKSMDPFLMN